MPFEERRPHKIADPDPENLRILDDEKDAAHHDSNLYDQNESRAGERIDLATGKPINNDGNDPAAADHTLRIVEPGVSDVLPPIKEENDQGLKWLRENDKGGNW
jgi:hypothetical protein